ncbi:MAG: hypothetical protein KIT49_11355 [Nitrospira sp.]|nr:hypothetical protein [Fimbriimonadaceae bacterium]MCW5788076.1 hypothetical protein [Nitrospira sp.]MCW5929995.1 hypothetical protein [Chitinophagaceae bacterium]
MMLVTVLSGCSSHERLYFVEESHIGLKAKAAVDGTPGEVDFGYRRSIMTLIPKANAGKSDEEKKKIETDRQLLREKLEKVSAEARATAEANSQTSGKSELEKATFVEAEVRKAKKDFMDSFQAARGEDPDCPAEDLDRSEPLSVISSFNAEVAWFEASRVHTYFATGVAATRMACRPQAIKALVTVPND